MAEAHTSPQREKIRAIYEYEEVGDCETLPDRWRFVSLAKLCRSFDYGTSAKSHRVGKVPVLRMGNIQNGKLSWDDLVYTSDEKEIRSYQLAPQTVLFNRTNSPELVGKTAIYRGERPAIFAGYLIRINTLPALDPEYLNLCLNTMHAREFCSQAKTNGVSQSNVNAQKLGAFEVPFCQLTEQQEIVRRARTLLTLVDQLETRLVRAKSRADALTPSVLRRAFRGELVPMESEVAELEGRSYESAADLLARFTEPVQLRHPTQHHRTRKRG